MSLQQVTSYSHQPSATESVCPELPKLNEGVSVQLLRRVWFATPEDKRKHVAGPLSLFESSVLVAGRAKALKLLTLSEVERALGAVTPKFFVRWYQSGLSGTQVLTFVVKSDADTFAKDKRLNGRPAVAKPLLNQVR